MLSVKTGIIMRLLEFFSESRYFFADFYVPDSLYYMRRAK